MSGHRLEVADVFHAHQHEFFQRWGHALSDQQRKVLRDIGLCRTAALGTHLEHAIAATMRPSLTIHAATGIVPSVSPRHAIAGS
jgi:hypothetical protein